MVLPLVLSEAIILNSIRRNRVCVVIDRSMIAERERPVISWALEWSPETLPFSAFYELGLCDLTSHPSLPPTPTFRHPFYTKTHYL